MMLVSRRLLGGGVGRAERSGCLVYDCPNRRDSVSASSPSPDARQGSEGITLFENDEGGMFGVLHLLNKSD